MRDMDDQCSIILLLLLLPSLYIHSPLCQTQLVPSCVLFSALTFSILPLSPHIIFLPPFLNRSLSLCFFKIGMGLQSYKLMAVPTNESSLLPNQLQILKSNSKTQQLMVALHTDSMFVMINYAFSICIQADCLFYDLGQFVLCQQ